MVEILKENMSDEVRKLAVSCLKVCGKVTQTEKENQVRQHLIDLAELNGLKVTASEFMRAVINFRILKGLDDEEQVEDFFKDNGITSEQFERFIEENILIEKLASGN